MHVDKYRCTVLTTNLRTAPLHKPPPLPPPLQPPPPPRHRQRPPQTLQNKTKPRTCIVYTRLRLLLFYGIKSSFFLVSFRLYLQSPPEAVESPPSLLVLFKKVRGRWVVGAGVGHRKKSEFRVSLSVKTMHGLSDTLLC